MIPTAWRRPATLVVAVAGLVALYAAVGFFVVPSVARSKIELLARTELGRQATIGKVEFNPFTLRARLSDFTLTDRDPGRTLLKFEALVVDVSAESLWRRAPVLDAVRLVQPRVEIARSADGRFGIQDLIERALAPSREPESRFAVNNIEIEDGSILLDDAVHQRRIAVTKLEIGLPFLSSLSRDAQIRVTPRLHGAVDGAPFGLTGTATSPFEDLQRATLELNLDALPLPRYLAYAPLPSGLNLTDGALTTRLSLAFVTSKGTPRGITLSGNARVDRLAIARREATPLIAARSIAVAIGNLDFLRRSIAVDRIAVDGPMLDLRRLADGTLEIQKLLAVTPESAAADTPGTSATRAVPAPNDAARPTWAWSVTETRVSGGDLSIADEAVAPPFKTTLSAITLTGAKLASQGAPGTLDVAFDSEDAHFAAHGVVDFAGNAARGHFDLTKLALARLRPYSTSVLAMDVKRGALDFGADFDAGTSPATRFTLAQGSAVLADLDVALRSEREPLWRMARASADGIALDLAARTATIERIEAQKAAIRLLRDADGRMHFERAMRTAPGRANPPDAAETAKEKAGDTDWHVVVRQLLLERFGVDLEDRVPDPAVKLRVADAKVVAENLDTARGSKAKIDVTARVGAKGRVRLNGVVSARPASADCRIDATALDLVPLRSYFESRTNVILTSGAVDAKGRITYGEAGTSGPQGRFVGDVIVNDFDSLDRPGSEELVRWKSLGLTGIDVTSAPFNLALNDVALDGFYARLILNADATLNVQRLLAPDASEKASATPAQQGSVIAAADAPPPAPAGERREIPASIGRIRLSNGEVEYSDFFVKPNYSAHLTDVTGSVSALAAAQSGTVELTAKIDRSAPVDIRGTVNPFAKELSLDLTAKATGVDLPSLTPYSVKYAGYGIQKGKLSMEVHYKLDNRKLSANNKLMLDQLIFGEHVDSPTATKLPVLLAVALLKDRNGMINLELPIEGTLDDPQFSVWRVVVQIFVNLLTKAVTAPFALLGAIGGGGGEQLAYVEFAPGSADLSAAALAKLTTLAKALTDRPGLKLDAAGRAIPDIDREALKRATLNHAMRIRKQKELASGGESAPALDALTIDAADRAKYLKAVYRDADLKDKPRNFLGIAKDVPPEQMEAMLLASYRIDDEALRELANHRANVVKEWFGRKGNVAPERVFVIAPRLDAEGIKADGAPTRVDFAIR
ncbi:MAG TPA: DUF748 domain-containing protein [Usitatibacteraceae bacterium]|nr:DUF748 domain-containing protein [Usitatibacteraceae bacterium]